ncbi:MAG: serine/threonine protein kinase [Leptolyngbyaceae cyanobacterium RU_5_1]|nr:serine/threonine protein kinase [Leptolyngbyaceae cyanobacterium RU_5_1]
MQTTIAGYEITEKLYESTNSLVYRAVCPANQQSVILKLLNSEYPSPETIAWFKREYEILRSLDLPGVVKADALINDQNRWVMVLEDFGGESLARLMQSRAIAMDLFFAIAIDLAEILAHVHQRQILHKDINPANLVFNPTTGQLKLIDFGIATVLAQENISLGNPQQLEGTLAYISPEQTGRMNRRVDYRTDLYSLGVTGYELLTGQLPFSGADALELVHAHIARSPVPLYEVRGGRGDGEMGRWGVQVEAARLPTSQIPEVLSDIVMKLMAKNAEDRYQSAYGLKADLEECYRQWQVAGEITDFPLAQQDSCDRFQIPQKLYGREREIEELLAAF